MQFTTFSVRDHSSKIVLQKAAKIFTEFLVKYVCYHDLKPPFVDKKAYHLSTVTSTYIYSLAKSGFSGSLKISPVYNRKMGVDVNKIISCVPSQLAKSLPHNIVVYATPPSLVGLCQVRSFKTDRNINAERLRHPNLFSRLLLLFGRDINPSSVIKKEKFEIGTTEHNSMKSISAEDGLSKEYEHKMKIAFAEGYLTGLSFSSQSKPTSFLPKLLAYIFGFIFGFSLIWWLSGIRVRIRIGNSSEVDPEEIIHVTFNDVKGVDEAKQELKDVVEFVKNPEKCSSLGGKLPRGVLLVGPPGTGKTLLARAVAGEAGVPFFYAAGSEFDEVFVGEGARRIRELFKAAKEKAPCVIFIDEIDSVGAKRTSAGLHPHANHTINQLLSEMDGFHRNKGVVVVGATNRRDELDKALLRPGRFDIEVNVPVPDYLGRKEILSFYLMRIRTKDVDVDILARGTTGFTGADLENMINQAALKAAIDEVDFVTLKHLELARDKILMGPERKYKIQDDETNEITAFHEAGHAIVAYYTKDSTPLHKVTIVPRGQSLGHTAYIPDKEQYHVTKSQLLATMDTMMGGRAAEELIYGSNKITTGASSDLEQATAIASRMVKNWGMSEEAGLRTYDSSKQGLRIFNEASPHTASILDSEINGILRKSYERAKTILKTHHQEHKQLAGALLKYETLDASEIKAILSGKINPPDEDLT